MIALHGLKNCDTCRRARRWLDQAGVDYSFVDVRENPPGEADLARWEDELGWSTLLNRRSTTWRALPAAERENLDATLALALLRQHPTLLKRPLLETPGTILCGFDEARYRALFNR